MKGDDMSDTIYTMDQWRKDRTFKAEPGQRITAEVYEEMLNCMPPRDISKEAIKNTDVPVHAGFMMGEPHAHDKAGALYLAFASNNYGKETKYYYLGLAHADPVLHGVYYHFDCMDAISDDLRPASEYKNDRAAIQEAANLEATLTRYSFDNGKLTGETVLYAPRYY